MSYNVVTPLPKTTENQVYTKLPPCSSDENEYHQSYPTLENFLGSALMQEAEEYTLIPLEVFNSSDVKRGRRRVLLTMEQQEAKNEHRKLLNRAAAMRSRRRKVEKIISLREGLKRMHKRCFELGENIEAVETELRNLIDVGHSVDVANGRYQLMEFGTLFNGLNKSQYEGHLYSL